MSSNTNDAGMCGKNIEDMEKNNKIVLHPFN